MRHPLPPSPQNKINNNNGQTAAGGSSTFSSASSLPSSTEHFAVSKQHCSLTLDGKRSPWVTDPAPAEDGGTASPQVTPEELQRLFLATLERWGSGSLSATDWLETAGGAPPPQSRSSNNSLAAAPTDVIAAAGVQLRLFAFCVGFADAGNSLNEVTLQSLDVDNPHGPQMGHCRRHSFVRRDEPRPQQP